MILPIALALLALELNVDVEELEAVATVELTEPEDFDPETGTVSFEGRRVLVEHFEGGANPLAR